MAFLFNNRYNKNLNSKYRININSALQKLHSITKPNDTPIQINGINLKK